MSSKTEEIISGLPLQKQKYVVAKLSGKSGYQAAISADYAHTTARNIAQIETPDVKAAFAELVRLKIPARKIISRLKQGLDAKQTKFFTSNGIVTGSRDTIDYKERREYLNMASQMGGFWTPKSEIDHSQKLDENTAKRLIAMAERLGLEDLDYEQRKELRRSHVTLELQAKNAEDSDKSTDSDGE